MLVVFFCVMMKILEFSSSHVVNNNNSNKNRNDNINIKNDIKSRQCLKRRRRGKLHDYRTVSFSLVSVAQAASCRIIWRGCGNIRLWPSVRYHPGTRMEGHRVTAAAVQMASPVWKIMDICSILQDINSDVAIYELEQTKQKHQTPCVAFSLLIHRRGQQSYCHLLRVEGCRLFSATDSYRH
jgi:hypothetical protein